MQGAQLKHTVSLKHGTLIWLFFCIFIIATARVVALVNIPVVIFLALSACVVLLCGKEELITYMCCLLPMMGLMQIRIALVITAIGYLLKIKKFQVRYFVPLVLLVLWELAHAGQTHITLYGFLRDFSPWFALSVLLVDGDFKICNGFAIRMYAFTTVICSILNFAACSIQYGYSITSLHRLGNLSADYEDFHGLINPNSNALICLVGISALLLLRYTKSEEKIDKFLIMALLLIILLTQSKSSILCVVLTYLLYIYTSGSLMILTKQKMKRLFLAIVLLIVAVVVFNDLLDAIYIRFTKSDITTGRSMIDLFYFRHVTSSLKYALYGIGEYKYNLRIRDMYGPAWQLYPGLATMAGEQLVYKPCHLAILEIVVTWGIVGLCIMVSFIRNIFKKGDKASVYKRVNIVTISILLVYSLQSEALGTSAMPITLLMALVCLVYNPKSAQVG